MPLQLVSITLVQGSWHDLGHCTSQLCSSTQPPHPLRGLVRAAAAPLSQTYIASSASSCQSISSTAALDTLLAPAACSKYTYCTYLLNHLCSAAAGAFAAHACTSGAYQDPNDPRTFVSWRFLDLPSTYFNNMAFVPAGKPMSLLPVDDRTSTSWGKEMTVKHSFICQTSSADVVRILVAAAEPGLVMDPEKWPGTCSEGGCRHAYTLHSPATMHLPPTTNTWWDRGHTHAYVWVQTIFATH